MSAHPEPSGFHVEKRRSRATITLSTGDSVEGCFFVAGTTTHGWMPERVADILNAQEDFFPFEVQSESAARTVLYNRAGIVTVELTDHEARRAPGYDVATRRDISVRLADGRQIFGTVRVYRPEGRDRLSDWGRTEERFRYLETGETTVIINVAHVIEISEDKRP